MGKQNLTCQPDIRSAELPASQLAACCLVNLELLASCRSHFRSPPVSPAHPPARQALTLGGQRGVEEALALLHYETELSMALLGCPSVDQITRDFVIQPPGYPLDVPAARR